MKQLQLFDSAGRPVPLGQEIASGGEGVIYAVPALNGFVAKVYRKTLVAEKQAKLLVMVKGCDEPLKKIAAWPVATLHSSGRQVCGFLMPKVSGCEPIHNLYSPGYRKQRHPAMTWEFLIYAARNTAAAFKAVHNRGHVIGDVNPNLVFVDVKSSFVKLIDCDSFQIADAGKLHPCEVGVSHFTPPELQKCPSFQGVQRTKNHDNFGLALLIFHLLMMGRHPFSGVFSGNGDMALEKSIEQFRYAFGRNATAKQMAPPPQAMTPAILPYSLAQLFEQAFTEQGVQHNGRPSAQNWLDALDLLKKELRTCSQQSIHKYYGGLSFCPWCQQEQKTGAFFFAPLAAATTAASNFSLTQAWSQIMAIQSPGFAPQVDPSHFRVTPKPLPQELTGFFSFLRFSKRAWIKKERQEKLSSAKNQFNAIQQKFAREAGVGKFHFKIKQLSELRINYETVQELYEKNKIKLKNNACDNHLKKFLERFFINDHIFSGIGIGRKAVLASFGIETAADIDYGKIIKIKGFGEKLTSELVFWRKILEQKFIFDPSKDIDAASLSALNYRFAQARIQIEKQLLAGPAQLTQIKEQILQRRKELLPMIEEAARQVAQAQADLDALG
jgi:DNA-binding helix-hairpin-helix protein with protein kinase domain